MRPTAFTACLLAFWALALVPATCGGGLLVHACEGDAEPVCHHEESCPADPCNLVSIAQAPADKGRADDDGDVITQDPVAAGAVSRPAFAADPRWNPPPLTAHVVPLRC